MLVTISVSVGDVVDKLTILNIKAKRIKKHSAEIRAEIKMLKKSIKEIKIPIEVEAELENVNSLLWDVEDKLRMHERMLKFDDEFIDLARKVYVLNDRRAEIKKEINLFSGSDIVEFKSYNK